MYAIVQLATHLAETVDVTVLVEKAEPVDLPGVRVIHDRSRLVGHRAVIVYADASWSQRDLDEVAVHTPLILYLQGFGIPGNYHVTRNILGGDRVIASSRWLADRAEELGCRAVHVPYGLDREVFYSGRPPSERRPVVSMMTHTLEWKGTADGLEALTRVRERLADVEIVLFGTYEPEFDAAFVRAPSRTEVADLLRRSCVFVCPSWEEGFGMPGMEALACGAALATTDTLGSRDYAVQGHTALVSRPHHPGSLADNVIELLRNPPLRDTLAENGRVLVENRFPRWHEAAERFLEAAEELADQPGSSSRWKV